MVSSTTIPSHEIGLWTVTQFILVLLFTIVTVVKLAMAVAEACTVSPTHPRRSRPRPLGGHPRRPRHTRCAQKKLSGWLCVDVLLYTTFLAGEVLYVVLASKTAALKTKTPDEIMDADDPFRA